MPEPIPSSPAAPAAFELLHAGVQRQLWRMGWKDLRLLQSQAIKLVMQTPHHLLLCAATASGKTEAAFLPVLSQIAEEPTGSVRAMYIGPLKALINDQFARVEELCGYLDMPVHRWHGDVPASKKAKLIDRPSGVLLITPESLESLFVNRSQFLSSLFAGLRFVVIDELHSFLDNERGLHLRSLLCRLRRIMPQPFRQIGLSATIGDTDIARRYLDAEHPDQVQLVNDTARANEVRLRIHGYCLPEELEVEPAEGSAAAQPPEEVIRMAREMVRHCTGHANLVFANSKGDVEEMADLCRRIGQEQALPDQFLVHHGSLSAEIREEAEAAMKSGSLATTFCSSTLEMGIDIGSVHMVGQIGAPWSVASMMQRLGRSGRKPGQPRIMRAYIQCQRPGAKADIFDRLHLELIQTVALVELMQAGWLEPARPPVCDLSTLSQQVMSVIAETGGIRADRLYERLCRSGAFSDIDARLFAQLLRSLAEADVVEQMDGGDLILGLHGERLRKEKGFYAAFLTPEAYAVLHQGALLGTLECAPQKEDHLLFAGRRWQVVEVDDERLELHVLPAHGWKRPRFNGGLGDVHPAVRQKMRQVLAATSALVYADPVAQGLVDEARHAAQTAGIFDRTLVPLGPHKTAIMTWTGTRIQQTLQAMLDCAGVETADEQIALVVGKSEAATLEVLLGLRGCPPDPPAVARHAPVRQRRKYDSLLNDALLDVTVGQGWLDVEGAAAQYPVNLHKPGFQSTPRGGGDASATAFRRPGDVSIHAPVGGGDLPGRAAGA